MHKIRFLFYLIPLVVIAACQPASLDSTLSGQLSAT